MGRTSGRIYYTGQGGGLQASHVWGNEANAAGLLDISRLGLVSILGEIAGLQPW